MKKQKDYISDEEFYKKNFQKDVLLSEKKRVTILAFIIIFISFVYIMLSLIINFIKDENILRTPLYISIFVTLVYIVREFVIRHIISRKIKNSIKNQDLFRYINTVFEVTFPSIILIILAYHWKSLIALSTPIVFIYMIIVFLSTLSLDYKISVFAGFISAIQFLIVSIYLLNKYDYPTEMDILNMPYIHVGKAFVIFLSGIVGGVISIQIKNRIFHSYKIVSERQRMKNLFGQQVSPEIVEELIENNKEIKGKRLYVCIMFLDIRGFTPFAEKREPEEIIEYQNKVFGFMIDEIKNNHGIINQFLGDGYMATFGAPFSRGNDCQNAVNAGLKIIKDLQKKNIEGIIPETNIGIGLHSGYIVAGNIGTNERKQYSITGNTVILASRIEQLNKQFKSQLLISQDVLDNIKIDEHEYKSLGEVELKGRKKTTDIFKLV